MIRRSVMLLAMLAMAGTALGQAPAQPRWQGHHGWKPTAQWRQKMERNRMDRLALLLDLAPAQRQKVQAILSEEHTKMRAAMQEVAQAMKQARAAHQQVRKDTMQRLSSVLSPTQMKKFEALMPGPGMMHGMMMHRMMMRPMIKGGMGAGMPMGPPPPPGPGPGPR
ncbi:MAG TPA: hypothetical protein VND24_08595 [Steroidobacteraceae bacterium]|nr:hypothetical protein [Steroidobacteraceae bacterium]